MQVPAPYCESSPLLKTVKYILNSVDEKGAWRGSDYEAWAPIITVLTLELLLRSGFTRDTEWLVVRGTTLDRVTLKRTIDFVNSAIQEDGSFGEDLWDTVRLGRMVEDFDLTDSFPHYPALKKYVLDCVAKGIHKRTDQTWSGPGTITAVVDYLDAAHEQAIADALFNDLLTLQVPKDGSFRGPVTEVGDDVVHPVWHTTQVLMTALRRGLSEKDQRITSMVDFLRQSQDKTRGCWRAFSRYDVYFTGYAILALNRLTTKPRDVLDKAVSWLCSQVGPTGKVQDAGGTIMAAIALSAQFPNQLEFRATLADMQRMENTEFVIGELNETVTRLQTDLSSREEELARYRKRFDRADIVFTKEEAFKYGLGLAFFGILLAIALGIGPFLLMRKDPPQPIYVTTNPQPPVITNATQSPVSPIAPAVVTTNATQPFVTPIAVSPTPPAAPNKGTNSP